MKIRIFLSFLIISLAGIPVFAAGPETGLWEVHSIGMPEPVYMQFRDDGYITSPEFKVPEKIPYNSRKKTFVFPELGLLRYTLKGDKMEIFFADITDDHPFVRSFVSAFDSGYNNEVEERFISEFQAAMIEVLGNTPFMIGYRVEPEG
jgi:hypothetical protein